ncbi:cytochrome P450 superfamily [Micractinium conductrix]|uniref:Cytochrome P450 superfamily n=1 Tax=Micractinium conductrix TaxID=554055 RepID=A0A2P6VLV3_9CHLO|nr:cytochrome P450 superfamily [Micractinium conductrix]|eukprot:PSC75082.1 cytochrome P450 superfamily [Micractinium conductrix]
MEACSATPSGAALRGTFAGHRLPAQRQAAAVVARPACRQGRHPLRVSASASGDPGKPKKDSLEDRIASGEFTDSGSTKERLTRPLRRVLAKDPVGPGRMIAMQLAKIGQRWQRRAATRMPTATGDIREIVGQPVFVPLFKLYQIYGKIFKLSFGPKQFVIVSDPEMAKQILLHNASNYSKGLLSEILDFVMGQGLIPADGEVWKVRRRAVVPALHKKYLAAMVNMFGECAEHGARVIEQSAKAGKAVEMENFFSRFGLDIIGKAVFNYDFDSLTHDDPVIQAVYTTLREAEYRSTYPIAYWNIVPLRYIVPRQRRNMEALQVIQETLNELIAKCKQLVEEEDEEFVEEFLSKADPSILHFLIASGDDITSKQLKDDMMTLLIAGHETTAAVLTWTFHCIADRPDVIARLREEVDEVLGDGRPGFEELRSLRYTTRVINESMRMYPQPPVLIRRALADDVLGGYDVPAGSDIFISTWNLHRSPELWDEPDHFNPDRFPVDGPTPNEQTHDFKYLPFGGGRRKCIGDQFALFEAVTALAMLIRRFDFERAPDAPPVAMTTGATIHTTNGLWLVPKARQMQQEQHAAGAGAGVAAAAFTEQRELALAFTEPAKPQQQTTATP